MSGTIKIGVAGESAVVKDLTDHGFKIDFWNPELPGLNKIEATKQKTKILVHVRAAVLPENPSLISSEEENRIKSHASKIEAIAYEARVQLDYFLNSIAIIYRILY
ncbi:MAG: hypothetical protein LCH54_02855 [Bacteroidetes bacterium]|nr:hypothetical protein [Bacteroidota bacterium]